MFNQLCKEIDFQVNGVANTLPLERRRPKGIGGDADDEMPISNLLQGKTDPVNRNGTLAHKAADYIGLRLDLQAKIIPSPLQFLDHANTVHMT